MAKIFFKKDFANGLHFILRLTGVSYLQAVHNLSKYVSKHYCNQVF